MAHSLQQQVLQRKLIYIGVLIGLFSFSWWYRNYFVEATAQKLALRETDTGDVELSGAAVRLLLTGSRGVFVCATWVAAIENQKKNQFSKLEKNVDYLTKYQPHFYTPWVFQSWNLAYNVSVEADRVKDKYYWMTRGIRMLARGEQQNRHHPDLRWHIGFYYQNKIATHDEKEKLLALFHMSTIDPALRKPERFTNPAWSDAHRKQKLLHFCRLYPQFIRRLNERVVDITKAPSKHDHFKDVIDFLKDNEDVPCYYSNRRDREEDETESDETPPARSKPHAEVIDRFPNLPHKVEPIFPQPNLPEDELTTDRVTPESFSDRYYNHREFDPNAVAKAWFSYGQLPVPNPHPIYPGVNEEIKADHRVHMRRPRGMATIIFRNAPPRAQAYIGERFVNEGWLDETWDISQGFPNDFRDSPDHELLGKNNWAKSAWERGFEMWSDHAIRNHLLFDEDEELKERKSLQTRGHEVLARLKIDTLAAQKDSRISAEHLSEDELKAVQSAIFLQKHATAMHLTNIKHFYSRADEQRKPTLLRAQQLLHYADLSRIRTNREKRLEYLEHGLNLLRDVFDKSPAYRNDFYSQEEAYEVQLKYLADYNDVSDRGKLIQRAMLAQNVLGGLAAHPLMLAPQQQALEVYQHANQLPRPWISAPFDKAHTDGTPYIPFPVVSGVASRSPGLADKAGRPLPKPQQAETTEPPTATPN